MNIHVNMNVCRVCMKIKTPPSVNIYENLQVSNRFRLITNINPDPNDNLPNELCQKCTARLKIAYEFRRQARESHEHLKKFLEKVNQQFEMLASTEKVEMDYEEELDMLDEDDTEEPATVIQTESFRAMTPIEMPQVKALDSKVEVIEMVDIQGTEEEVVESDDFPDNDDDYHQSSQVVYVQPAVSETHETQDSQPALKKTPLRREPNQSVERGMVHVCEKCSKVFSTKTNLSRHLQSHDGKRPFVCGTCNKGFTQNGSLKQHMLLHSGERPYQCDVCERAFTQAKSLIFHMRRHTGEKPFQCEFCKQKFRQRDGLKRHVQVKHNAELKFQCTVCNESFQSRATLILHKKEHGDDEEEVEVEVKEEKIYFLQHFSK